MHDLTLLWHSTRQFPRVKQHPRPLIAVIISYHYSSVEVPCHATDRFFPHCSLFARVNQGVSNNDLQRLEFHGKVQSYFSAV